MTVTDDRADVAAAGSDAHAVRRRSIRVRAIGALRPLLPLITLCVIFAIVNPDFLQPGNLRGIVEQNVVVMAAAVGVMLVILMGAIDLSVEGVLLLSSVVVALLVQNSATSVDLGSLGVLAGCALGALFGLVNGVLTRSGGSRRSPSRSARGTSASVWPRCCRRSSPRPASASPT